MSIVYNTLCYNIKYVARMLCSRYFKISTKTCTLSDNFYINTYVVGSNASSGRKLTTG